MPREYSHYPMGEEVVAAAGRYAIIKGMRLAFGGREIFYVVGFASVDSSCCGVGGAAYAVVPGYIIEWRSKTDKDGHRVSIVEPIKDAASREAVAEIIRKTENIEQVNFL